MQHRLLVLAVLALLALGAFLPGCGGGGGPLYTSTLVVQNENYSTDVVVFIELDGFIDYGFSTSLAPGEQFVADVEPGRYDIYIDWGDGSTNIFFDQALPANRTVVIEVAN